MELSSFTNQVNALNKDSQLGRLAEEDLGHVIHLIDRGINEGVLKVSERMIPHLVLLVWAEKLLAHTRSLLSF